MGRRFLPIAFLPALFMSIAAEESLPLPVFMVSSDSTAIAPGSSAASSRHEVFIEGGLFQLGSLTGGPDEKPLLQVRISDFYMMSTELTQRTYEDICGCNPASGYGRGNDYPVYSVSWFDAVAFANKLSMADGFNPVYTIRGNDVACDFTASGWRLPTEAEWEYASRGGGRSRGFTYSGSNDIGVVALYASNSGSKTKEVGSKAPNELGLYDMSGNVWEWCWDWYAKDSYSRQRETDNPKGVPSGEFRVFRGGGCFAEAALARSSYRYFGKPGSAYSAIGFRLVRRP